MADTKVSIILEAKDQYSKEMDKLKTSASDLADSFKKVGAGLTAAGIAGAFVISDLAKAAGEFEQVSVAFEVMTGSAEKANKLMQDLATFATQTPFELTELQNGTKRLLAFGVEADDIIPTMEGLGNIAAGVGKDKFPQLITALGQVKAKSKLSGEELLQFTEAGVGLGEELSKLTGIPLATIVGQTADLGITYDQVHEALMRMSGEGGRFFNLMDAQSLTLLGQWSNVTDAFDQTKIALGSALLEPLKNMSAILIDIAGAIQSFVQSNPKLVEIIGTIGLIGTAFALIAGPILIFIGFIPQIVAGMAMVATAFSAVIWPITAIGLALATLYLAWDSNLLGIKDITNTFVAKIKELWESMTSWITSTWDSAAKKLTEDFTSISKEWTDFWGVWGEDIKKIWGGMIDGITLAWGIFSDYLGASFEAIKLVFKLFVDSFKTIFEIGWDLFAGAVKTVLLLFQGDWEGAWNTVKSTFGGVWDSIKDFASNTLDSIAGMVTGVISKIIEAIEKVKEFIGLSKNMEGVRTNINSIAGIMKAQGVAIPGEARASGGAVNPAKSYLVGENGPEVFSPDRSGYITANSGGSGKSIYINITGTFMSDEAAEEMATKVVRNLQMAGAVN